MKRCTRCILPEDFPNIRFDPAGVCNYCLEWDGRWQNFNYESSEKEIRRIFAGAMAKKRRYDCLIPYSGGRDSTYVAYLCKKKYGLTPLLVTFNNCFMSEYALQNILNTVRILNVDHIFCSYKPEDLRSFYRTMLINAGEFCSICTSGINYVRIKYQRLFNIPLVILGTSSRTDEQSPLEIITSHPFYVRKVLLKNGFENGRVAAFLLRRHFEWGILEKIKAKLLGTDYQEINLPDYVPWNNQKIQDVMEEELGWKTPDKKKDHIDCRFVSIKYYLKNKQIPHFIFKQEKYSQLIRDGQMTREEALIELNKLLKIENEEPVELKDFLRFFDLKMKDIENREKKSHLNFISKEDLEIKESLISKIASLPWRLYKKLTFY